MSNKYRYFTRFFNGDDRKGRVKELMNKCDWLIGQDEIGKHGMEHVQFVFGFKNPRNLSAITKLLKSENVQPAIDVEKLIKYCTDESKRDENGELYVHGDVPKYSKKVSKDTIAEALETNDYVQAMKIIEEKDPLYYIQNQKKLSVYFCEKFDNTDKGLFNKQSFNILQFQDFRKVLVFIGSTGLGKIQFALSHFDYPLHIRDKEDWRRYNNRVDGIILDDLDFPSWSPLTFLKLLDLENPITQNIKYGSIRIKARTPRIICCNHLELLWPRNIHEETKNACLRRMEIHNFHTKLYDIVPLSQQDVFKDSASTQNSQVLSSAPPSLPAEMRELFDEDYLDDVLSTLEFDL